MYKNILWNRLQDIKVLHESDDTNDIQSQSPGGVMQKKADKICKSHRKAPVLEPLPNKVQDVNLWLY